MVPVLALRFSPELEGAELPLLLIMDGLHLDLAAKTLSAVTGNCGLAEGRGFLDVGFATLADASSHLERRLWTSVVVG